MIQEILDYLLIRSLLYNSDADELIEAIKEKEDFTYVLDNIHMLMQEENFIFVAPHLVFNVSELITKYRFDYIKNKELNDKMNDIIGRLNDYKYMSDKRKQYIINNWIEEESNNRNLPLCYRNLTMLLGMISLDTAYFQGMINIDKSFDIGYVIEYVSIINIIMNKFPECFHDNPEFLEITKQNLMILKGNKEISRVDSRMIKRTIKKMQEKYSLSETKNFQKVIKKTQN